MSDEIKIVDPTTPAEWQEAVDGANFWLTMDSAMQYGLIKRVPLDSKKDWWYKDSGVNIERCQQLLEIGLALGFNPVPAEKLIEKYLTA